MDDSFTLAEDQENQTDVTETETPGCSSGSHPTTLPKEADYDDLYERVRDHQRNSGTHLFSTEITNADLAHEYLSPTLRLYQQNAVRWMLHQEKYGPLKGGILADEMGLGKTVEVLALVLNNPGRNKLTVSEKEPVITVLQPKQRKRRRSRLENAGVKVFCPKCSGKEVRSPDGWKTSHDPREVVIQEVIDKFCGDITAKRKRKCNCNSSQLRQRLTEYYNATLDRYQARQGNGDTELEASDTLCCPCGGVPKKSSPVVQCGQCNRSQHSFCVNYDLEDRYRGDYYCPQCWVRRDLIDSNVTLIITPASISYQWVEEIAHHIKNPQGFKVLVYQGISKQGYLQPFQLAGYDIIITTYEVLRKELYFADVRITDGGRPQRRSSFYMAPPSPLVSVRYWRVCLDEAQMVEGSTTRAAEMARRFETVHKWCVTGTPVQKSINDLFGLFVFLDYSPFNVQQEFRDKLMKPFAKTRQEALVDALAPVLWRTRKIHVENEVEIPPQKQLIHWLRFTPVEEHFYQQQHGLCREDFLSRIFKFAGNLNSKISALDRKTFNTLLYPLLRLRQASIHPQMVRGHFVPLRHVTLTMEELLHSLIKKTQVNCEESQRCRVAATNGLAALHMIRRDWSKAAECYRDVLRWADEFKDSVKTDSLQRLHALHNLAELLQTARDVVPPTLRDSELEKEADELRKQYLGRVSAQVETALQDLAPVTVRAGQLKTDLEGNGKQLGDAWWLMLLQWCESSNLDERCVGEVRERLEEEAQNLPGKLPSLAKKFSNVDGLRFLLYSRLEEMEEQRTAVMKGMKRLELMDSGKLAKEAVDCHLRMGNGKARKNIQRCQLCTVHDQIEDYESLLFRMADRQQQDAAEDPDPVELELNDPELGDTDVPNLLGSLRKGTWADSEAERILKFLLGFARKSGASTAIQDGGVTHLRIVETYKKEFRLLRVVWRQFNDQASAVDELSMATLRLRLRLPGEEAADARPSGSRSRAPEGQNKLNYILDPHEVDPQFMKLKADLAVASNDLKKHMGHVLFLKNLEKNGYGKRGTHNPDPCPVCQSVLGSQWSVLRCGHSFCMECVRLIVGQFSGGKNLRCPVCRETNPVADIAYVDTQADSHGVDSEIKVEVKGSHSTKIEAVVRQLLLIQATEPGAKCLVFSSWADVLVIIARALAENSITHCSLFSHNFQNHLSKFKHDPTVTVLLIPVQSGANGLNLIEASHVILVEPILNPGSELQAIGRVHRIGQTKPTVVHKFYIRGTIEERMTKMLEKHHMLIAGHSAGSSRENPVTIADLKSLFEEDGNDSAAVTVT